MLLLSEPNVINAVKLHSLMVKMFYSFHLVSSVDVYLVFRCCNISSANVQHEACNVSYCMCIVFLLRISVYGFPQSLRAVVILPTTRPLLLPCRSHVSEYSLYCFSVVVLFFHWDRYTKLCQFLVMVLFTGWWHLLYSTCRENSQCVIIATFVSLHEL